MAMAMAFWKGQPLVTKLSWLSTCVVFPGAMLAALIYSPPDFGSEKKQAESSSSSN